MADHKTEDQHHKTEPHKPEEARPKTVDQRKEKEVRAARKAAVRAACDELHARRPQPRADQIESVLDQIRAMEEPPKDAEASKAKAKELYDKSYPKVEDKPVEGSKAA